MRGGAPHSWACYRDRETQKWDEYFAEALCGQGQEHHDTLWWRLSDRDSFAVVKELFEGRKGLRILEPACGSGGTSLALVNQVDVAHISLLDASENALRFAERLASPELRDRVTFTIGDAFELPFDDGSFDLTWNVGVIEHYPVPAILQMIAEMLRVTDERGFVVVAIPNRNSIATLKAWILGTAWGRRNLKLIEGYRFDTEILYSNRELKRLLEANLGVHVTIRFAGSCLWVGATERLVVAADRLLMGSPLSFLSFFILSSRPPGAPRLAR